ncbi:hypothetical protein HYV49_04825 [Candidatus Pacearchaeota archaeon]|nr:hypothetical protein [Candidatus Pacearchaeota archaeon]
MSKYKYHSKELTKILREVRKCDGCEYEMLEVFKHAKANPTDKVYLAVGYDKKDKVKFHVGIKFYNKTGRKIIR